MKRKLNEEETRITNKSLARMDDELGYNKYQFDICELKLARGIKIDYLKQIRDYSKLKRDFADEMRILDEKINILKEQLKNGVEIKEDVLDEDKSLEKEEI